MPGGWKKKNKKKPWKKQSQKTVGNLSSSNQQKGVSSTTTTIIDILPTHASVHDTIVVDEIIVLDGLGNNNEEDDKKFASEEIIATFSDRTEIKDLNNQDCDSGETGAESVKIIDNHEKAKDVTEKIVDDSLIITKLITENEILRNEVDALQTTAKDLKTEFEKLTVYMDCLKQKTESDELLISNLTSNNQKLKNMLEVLQNPQKGFLSPLRNMNSTLSSLIKASSGQSKGQGESLLRGVNGPHVRNSLQNLLASILPSKLIIPITQLDIVLENIPIIKNLSGQSYKPSAESYSSKDQSRGLVGQDDFAENCGLVFTTWDIQGGKDVS